jgi:tRNA dimethylallyltransferase
MATGAGAPGPAPLLVVLGPTAAGKSEFALLACERFGGEVLSVDSMQVYRGLDRGTSKPAREALRRAPHHGIDLADPGQDFSLGDFVREGERTIAAIRGRGRLPILVGGTGLYLRGLLKGIAEAPRRSEAFRGRLRAIEGRRGAPFLHRMLRRVDPAAARRLGPRDRQRVVRALEVFFAARRGLSSLIGESPFGADRYPAIKIGLEMPRAALYRRIDERVVAFFESGLVEEVRGLLRSGCPPSANAWKALGYRESLRHLHGELALEEAIALTQRNTRRYAKRQWTWFRKEEGVVWFDVDPSREDRFGEPLAHVARALGHG